MPPGTVVARGGSRTPNQPSRWDFYQACLASHSRMQSLLLALFTAVPHDVLIDFDVPRRGPACIAANVSDTAVFRWSERHNLYELISQAAYTSCDFSSATQYASAGPNAGVRVPLSEGNRYFACSKICRSNGHKVKICVGASSCDCPEGTEFSGQVSAASSPDLQLALTCSLVLTACLLGLLRV